MDYIIELIKSAVPDTKSALIYVILTFLTLWMYKELRKNYMESRREKLLRFEKAIECFSDVELEIYKFISEKSDFYAIAEKVSRASSLMPYNLIMKYNRCKEEKDTNRRNHLVLEFHADIQEEIKSLKYRQSDLVTLKSDDSMFEIIENYMRTKIAPFVMPLIQTFVNLTILFFIVFLTELTINSSTVQQRILYLSIIFVLIFYVAFISLLLGDVIIKGRFKHSTLNWTLFLLFAILPPIFLFTGPWYRGIMLITLMIAYFVFASKNSIKDHLT